jgi:hypothetical protein
VSASATLALGAEGRNLSPDARRALEEILTDEPDWAGMFYVERVELDERNVSAT